MDSQGPMQEQASGGAAYGLPRRELHARVQVSRAEMEQAARKQAAAGLMNQVERAVPMATVFAMLGEALDQCENDNRVGFECLARFEQQLTPILRGEGPETCGTSPTPDYPFVGESPVVQGLLEVVKRLHQLGSMQRSLNNRISGVRDRLEI